MATISFTDPNTDVSKSTSVGRTDRFVERSSGEKSTQTSGDSSQTSVLNEIMSAAK